MWKSEKVLDWSGLLAQVVVAGLAVYLEFDAAGEWASRVGIIALLFVTQLALFILFLHNPQQSRNRQITLVWLQTPLIVSLYFLIDTSIVAILGIVWVVQVAETYSIRSSVWLFLAAITIFAVSQFYHWWDDLLVAVIGSATLALFHLFALGATHRAQREQKLREQTAQLNNELIATRQLLSQSSRQSERLRIARDLHDLLGHHMTALILNLEVALHCTEGKGNDKVEQALAMAKLLLSDLRTAVSELRENDEIDFGHSIEKLLKDVPGLAIEVDFSAAPPIKEFRVAETLLRCVQEAITNVLRHSNATECKVSLTSQNEDVVLTVSDNGNSTKLVVPGNGLTGMQERVRNLGGEINWEQLADTFSLRVRLPPGESA
ncbi:MAG: sensor histidine kinase [Pseudohongiellaceae bacterium]